MPPEQEVRARHILVEKEDEAKKAQARIKGGEDFAKVAGELSKDPGSKTDGGDLGFFTKDRMVEPFAEAAFKMRARPGLRPGEVPVRLARHQGRGKAHASRCRRFDEMKDQVDTYLERKAQQDLIVGLRGSAKIERWTTRATSSSRRSPETLGHQNRGGAAQRPCAPGPSRVAAGLPLRKRGLDKSLKKPHLAKSNALSFSSPRPGSRMSKSVSPLAPKSYPDAASHRRRADRDRRGGHPLQEPHRRALRVPRPRARR